MNCPKCNHELVRKYYKGMIDVDSCPNCRGMWLDSDELDQLEDMVFDNDLNKGSLIHHQSKTHYPCPHCGGMLDEFQYRLFDLKLDYCAENDHGFWLDEGEDERVMELMALRSENMRRKSDAEKDWRGFLRNMHLFLKKEK